MVVRIIKTEPHRSILKEAICTNCGSTLEYTPSDVKEDYSTDYIGGKDYYKYISCLNCSHKVIVR